MPKVSKTSTLKNTKMHVVDKRRHRIVVRRIILGGVLFSLFTLVSMVVWLTQSGVVARTINQINDAFLIHTAKMGLTVKEVFLEGQRNTPTDEMLKALDVRLGDPIFGLHLDEIRKRIETNTWIAEASVERQFPHTLHVRIVERKPIAVWQHARQLYLIDAEGEIIVDDHMERFNNLLLVVGKNAPEASKALLHAITNNPVLYGRIAAAIRVGARRWDLQLKDGKKILLPEHDLDKSLIFLSKLHEKTKILDQSNISRIDLRIPEKVYVLKKNTTSITTPLLVRSSSQDNGEE